MVTMKRTKNKPTRRHARNRPEYPAPPQKLPFIAHIRELRKRLFFIAISATVFGGLAYAANKPITALLLKPAGSQQFIYTTPGGGFDFLFKLCLYVGIAASIPVIVYQLLRYVQPLIKRDALKFIVWGSIASAILGCIGILFGYHLGLPAAMHFLLQGFSSDQIKALISIQSYMSFVMLYLLGSALLFQVPLVLLLINRIKPLKPGTLMKFQRWFIIIAFILGAIVNPSPNIQDQLMLSIPMILMYQLGIFLVWTVNRKYRKPKKILELLRQDAEMQATRMADFMRAKATWDAVVATTNDAPPASPHKKIRPKQYVDFRRPRRSSMVGRPDIFTES